MTNIPTELLRTLIAVVDLRSFTKAAHSLGVTQPAVSAQIKRLQALLNCDLLDKSAPGVSLTPIGEHIVTQARRLLSINDKILDLAEPAEGTRTLRFGLPGDFVGPALWFGLAGLRDLTPDLRFHMRAASSDTLLRDLLQGELEVVVATSYAKPLPQARHHWAEDTVWIRGPQTKIDPGQPVPLVTRGEHCLYHRQMVEALENAGHGYTTVFTASRINQLGHLVQAGLGVTALPRTLALSAGAMLWEDGPLPRLGGTICNVCVREDLHAEAPGRLADVLAEALRPTFPDAGACGSLPPAAAAQPLGLGATV